MARPGRRRDTGERTSLGKARTPMGREDRRQMLLLVINTANALALYFGCVALDFSPIFWIYTGLAAVLLIGYVVYNRGFVLRGVTPDMLPDTLSLEEKNAMLAEAKRRRDASRFMVTLIVPLLLAVLIDAIYLLLLEDILISLGVELG